MGHQIQRKIHRYSCEKGKEEIWGVELGGRLVKGRILELDLGGVLFLYIGWGASKVVLKLHFFTGIYKNR